MVDGRAISRRLFVKRKMPEGNGGGNGEPTGGGIGFTGGGFRSIGGITPLIRYGWIDDLCAASQSPAHPGVVSMQHHPQLRHTSTRHMNHNPIGTLHHVELYVSNLAESIRFWGWLLEQLGYQHYQKWALGSSWRLGATYIVFVQTEDPHLDPPYHRCRTGLNHLAFHAGTSGDVDRLTSELRERGYRLLYEDRHPFAVGPDYYAAFFEDPDRIKVELVAGSIDQG